MLYPNDEDGNPKTDPNNPDEKLKSRARMEMIMMTGFAYDEDNVWDDGELYDPKKGKNSIAVIFFIFIFFFVKDNKIIYFNLFNFTFSSSKDEFTRRLN